MTTYAGTVPGTTVTTTVAGSNMSQGPGGTSEATPTTYAGIVPGTSWSDPTTVKPVDFYQAGNSTASATEATRIEARATVSAADVAAAASTDQETSEGYKPQAISLADIVRLMAEYPDTIESILDSISENTGNINDILNVIPSEILDGIDLKTCFTSVDGIVGIIDAFTSGDFEAIPILRTIKDFASGLQFDTSSIISTFTGLLPSSMQSLISDAEGLYNTIVNLPSLISNFSPANIAGWAMNAFPIVGTIANFLGIDLSDASSFVDNMVGGVTGGAGAGITAGGAGGFTQKTLPGGVEFPDGVRLSEIHARPKRKSSVDGVSNRPTTYAGAVPGTTV